MVFRFFRIRVQFLGIDIIQKMQQINERKQSDSQFICKLQDMMEKHPRILNWSSDGSELVILDMQAMQQDVLPRYFRHSNFGSFVRQLNMYSFHKISRQINKINFKNDIFWRGNQAKFHNIKRKKKSKDDETSRSQFEEQFQNLVKSIDEDTRLTPSVKALLHTLIQFKFVAVENQIKIRRYLDSICKQLKDSRSQKVTSIVADIKKNSLEQLQENLNISKAIDQYIEQYFTKDLRPHRPSSNTSIPLLEQNKTINEIMVQAKNLNFHSANSLMNLSQKKDLEGNQQDGEVSFEVGMREPQDAQSN